MPAAAVLVALGAFAMLWALIGLQYGYGYTLGAFLQQLARAIGAIRLPSFLSGARLLGFAADAITAIDNAVRRAIGLGIEASGAVFNECLAVAVHFVGNEIASLSHDAAQAIEHLHVQQITNVYKRVNPGLARKVGTLAAAVAVLRRELTHAVSREAHVARTKAQSVERAIAIPAPVALPKAWPRIGQLEREAENALGHAKDFLRRYGPAALVGTVAFALARLGVTWARCSHVNKVGKRACGMNPDLLESLLADTLLIAGTVSLVEFARGMQDVTEEVTPLIRTFWRAT